MPRGPYKNETASPTSRVSRSQLLGAARRVFIDGENQADVARELGVSGSYLGRLLRDARDKGWIHIWVDADTDEDLARQIRAKYPHLKYVEVVRSRATPEDTCQDVATAMARWFNDLLDRDAARPTPLLRQVSIGGASTHRLMVEQLGYRATSISVAPTSMTPSPFALTRYTAPMVAEALALRLGAFGPRGKLSGDPKAGPFLHAPSRLMCVPDSPDEARSFFAGLSADRDYQRMLEVWGRSDVVFLSAMAIDGLYPGVVERIQALGGDVGRLRKAGAVAIVANQFVNARGEAIPLTAEAAAYEVTLPLRLLELVAKRHQESEGQAGFVVLDLWGEKALSAKHFLSSSTVGALFCDSVAANALS